MSLLALPNVLADGIVADGSNIQANNQAILNWANGSIGNTNFSAVAADALALSKFAAPRHVTSITAVNDGGDYQQLADANKSLAHAIEQSKFATNVWVTLYAKTCDYVGRIVNLSTYLRSTPNGTWEVRLSVNAVPTGAVLTPVAAGLTEQVQNIALAATNVISIDVRRTTAAGTDRLERIKIDFDCHFNHQTT